MDLTDYFLSLYEVSAVIKVEVREQLFQSLCLHVENHYIF